MAATDPITISASVRIAEQAAEYTPGGVHSSTRGLNPRLVWKQARGSKVIDVDGREYIDYHAAFGPIILGHCDPQVDRSAAETIGSLDLMGVGTTEQEAELARKLVEHIPSAEQALLCVTGSEATYNAVRVARAVTGRTKLIKFQGCYHGWHDYLCMNILTKPERMGQYDPASAGTLEASARETVVLDFNCIDQVEDTLRRQGGDIAAVILEPIPHNIGCVLPKPEFLKGLQELCTQYGVILIFDEVITGFRHGLGGFQAACGVTPDLTTVAKSMANGYPCAALCGRRAIMQRFQTAGGDVFFAGTYNAHPVGVAAALATIAQLESGEVHERLFRFGEQMRTELTAMVERRGVKAHVAQYGSVFVLYFMEPPVESYTDVLRNDTAADLRFRREMGKRGCFCLPLAVKRNHISAAHTQEDLDRTLEAADDVLKEMGRG
jgi:glutamate-1-semialdehyde 2,1-aminomutase